LGVSFSRLGQRKGKKKGSIRSILKPPQRFLADVKKRKKRGRTPWTSQSSKLLRGYREGKREKKKKEGKRSIPAPTDESTLPLRLCIEEEKKGGNPGRPAEPTWPRPRPFRRKRKREGGRGSRSAPTRRLRCRIKE